MIRSISKFSVLILLSVVFFSCKKPKVPNIPLRVLVLGNSITYSPANPGIGWNGNWGMAASAANKDYVHLLEARFKQNNPAHTLSFKNIAAFEAEFDTYDLDQNLKSYRNEKPNILILRIGENVTRTADSVVFRQKYKALIDYFKTNDPSVKILAVGSVWPEREMAEKVMRSYSSFRSLAFMNADLSNFAFGQFTDPGVQSHPSDKGMQAISDAIWDALQTPL